MSPEQMRTRNHEALPPVEFDAAKARTMTDIEVRAAYPRGDDVCPICKQRVIRYSSLEHYVSGDW